MSHSRPRQSYAGSGDTLGARLWACAPSAANLLFAEQYIRVAGRHVIDLGCGVALPGLLCAKMGAARVSKDLKHVHSSVRFMLFASQVVLTDYADDTLANARKNVIQNACEANAGMMWSHVRCRC